MRKAYPEATYADGACQVQFGNKSRASLSFDDIGTKNQYEHIRITLFNEHGREVESTLIGLRAIIGAKPFAYYGGETGYPFIWENGGVVNWFGYAPTEKDYEPLTKVIAAHLAAFQALSQEMNAPVQQFAM